MAITSVANFAQNINDYIKAVEEENEIVCIKTQKNELYLVDKNMLDEIIDEPYILQGLDDIKHGRVSDGETFINELLKEYDV